MLSIKLRRVGKKHQPSFRIVVAEKRSKVQGKYVDDLGWYNPRIKQSFINKEKVLFWIKNGAQPTITLYNLFIKLGIIKGKKIAKHKKIKQNQSQVQQQASSVASVSNG
ncbi:MAG: 30S ribosomal protein S16 [Minisyncoccia bacterium]